jgi:hypothetical protein
MLAYSVLLPEADEMCAVHSEIMWGATLDEIRIAAHTHRSRRKLNHREFSGGGVEMQRVLLF